MDLINRLLPNRTRPAEAEQPASISHVPRLNLYLDRLFLFTLWTMIAAVCESPCSVHPHYPGHLKIDDGDMRGSVKRHRRHILVAQGRPYSRWPEEVTDQADAYITALTDLIRDREGRIGYKVRVSETDAKPVTDEDGEAGEAQQEEELSGSAAADGEVDRVAAAGSLDRADLYVFPDMLLFPAVSRASLAQWVDGLLVADKGAMHFKQQHATVAAERVRQAERAAAAAVAAGSAGGAAEDSALPDIDFECRVVSGCAMLICAHKLRDKRCGVTGPILAKQIQLESEERQQAEERENDTRAQQRIRDGLPPSTSAPLSSQLPVRTLLISHIGGHKYAGNVIAYPAGVWYGRVTPCHVHLLLDAHATQPQAADDVSEQQKRIAGSRRKLDELRRGEVELEW